MFRWTPTDCFSRASSVSVSHEVGTSVQGTSVLGKSVLGKRKETPSADTSDNESDNESKNGSNNVSKNGSNNVSTTNSEAKAQKSLPAPNPHATWMDKYVERSEHSQTPKKKHLKRQRKKKKRKKASQIPSQDVFSSWESKGGGPNDRSQTEGQVGDELDGKGGMFGPKTPQRRYGLQPPEMNTEPPEIKINPSIYRLPADFRPNKPLPMLRPPLTEDEELEFMDIKELKINARSLYHDWLTKQGWPGGEEPEEARNSRTWSLWATGYTATCSVAVKINFLPYMVVRLPKNITPDMFDELKKTLNSKRMATDSYGKPKAVHDISVCGQNVPMVGYSGGRKDNTVHMYFATKSHMNHYARKLKHEFKFMNQTIKCGVYEEHVGIPLQFLRQRKINLNSNWLIKNFQVKSKRAKMASKQLEISVFADQIFTLPKDDPFVAMPACRFGIDGEMLSAHNTNKMPAARNPSDMISLISTEIMHTSDTKVDIKVLHVLGSCDDIPGVQVMCFSTERELLASWLEMYQGCGVDCIISYNGINFDMPYFYDRAAFLKLEAFKILSPFKRWKCRKAPVKIESNQKQLDFDMVEIPCVEQLDLMLFFSTQKIEGGYSLSNVAEEKLPPEPLDDPDDFALGSRKYGNDGELWECKVKPNAHAPIPQPNIPDIPSSSESKGPSAANPVDGANIVSDKDQDGDVLMTTKKKVEHHWDRLSEENTHIFDYCFEPRQKDGSLKLKANPKILNRHKFRKSKTCLKPLSRTTDEAKLEQEFRDNVGNSKFHFPYEYILKYFLRGSYHRSLVGMYCCGDTSVMMRLCLYNICILQNIEMSALTNTDLTELLTKGTSCRSRNLITYDSYNMGYYMNLDVLDLLNTRFKLEFPGNKGGKVLLPVPGFHKWITTLDFASLYPSIAIAHNLCYSSFIMNKEQEELAKQDGAVFYEDSIEGRFPLKFVKKSETFQGFLPIIWNNTLVARGKAKKVMKAYKESGDKAKAAVWNAKQLALKLAGNGLYGFLGAFRSIYDSQFFMEKEQEIYAKYGVTPASNPRKCKRYIMSFLRGDSEEKFGKKIAALPYKKFKARLMGFGGARGKQLPLLLLAAAITSKGRHAIETSVKTIVEEYKSDCVYGDTDSIMIRWNKRIVAEAMKLKTTVERLHFFKKLGDEAGAKITAKFDKGMLLRYEKIFKVYLLPGAKKTYAGDYRETPKTNWHKPKLSTTGLGVKSDQCALSRDIMLRMLTEIILHDNIPNAMLYLKVALREIVEGNVELDHFRIFKKLGKLADGTRKPSALQDLVIRLSAKDKDAAPKRGAQVGYVIAYKENLRKTKLKLTDGNAYKCSEMPSDLCHRKSKYKALDLGWYIRKQIGAKMGKENKVDHRRVRHIKPGEEKKSKSVPFMNIVLGPRIRELNRLIKDQADIAVSKMGRFQPIRWMPKVPKVC